MQTDRWQSQWGWLAVGWNAGGCVCHLIINLSRDYFYSFRLSTNIKYLASESNKFRSQCLTYGFRLQSDVGWICKWLVIIMFMHISSGFRLTNVFLVCLFVFYLFRCFFILVVSYFLLARVCLTGTRIHFHRWIFKWLHLTTGKKGSLLSSLSWFPLAIYSTTTWRKRTQRPRNAKGWGLEIPRRFTFPVRISFFFRWIHLENLWQRQQEKCIATETTRNCFSRSLKKNGKGSRRETTPTTGDRRTEVQRSTYPEMEMENRTETTIPLDWKKFLKAAFRPIKSYYILINSAADKSQKLWDTLTLDVVDAD